MEQYLDFEQPIYTCLEKIEELKNISFHKKIGSVGQKTLRLAALEKSFVCDNNYNKDLLAKAIQLLKFDLLFKDIFLS